MKNLAVLLLLMVPLVVGCANLAQHADDMRDSTEWMLCKAMTVGAWTRAYGNDKAKADAWRVLCAESFLQTPAK